MQELYENLKVLEKEDCILMEFDEMLLSTPPSPEGFFTKALVKAGGMKLIVHKYDKDPFPSSPHAHENIKGWKINLYTGEIYDKNKNIVRKILPKVLKDIQEEFIKRGREFPNLK